MWVLSGLPVSSRSGSMAVFRPQVGSRPRPRSTSLPVTICRRAPHLLPGVPSAARALAHTQLEGPVMLLVWQGDWPRDGLSRN